MAIDYRNLRPGDLSQIYGNYQKQWEKPNTTSSDQPVPVTINGETFYLQPERGNLVQGTGMDRVGENLDDPSITGYTLYSAAGEGKHNYSFDKNGKFQGYYQGNEPFTIKNTLIPGLATIGLGMGLGSLANFGMTGSWGLGGASTGGPNFSQGFTDGGTAGGALDASYAGTGAGGYGPNFSQGFTDGGTAGGALDTGYATGSAGTPWTTGAGAVTPVGAGGGAMNAIKTAGSSLLNSIPGGAGTVATLLGAAAGSQGTPGQTSERKMDPRLDAYVYGPNGLMPMTQSLLQQQMPIAMQQGNQLMQFGQGLLGRGIAANPFKRG